MLTHVEEELLARGLNLREFVCSRYETAQEAHTNVRELVLSFDLFTLLVEYTALVNKLLRTSTADIVDLLRAESLGFFVDDDTILPVVVSYDSPAFTLRLR